MLEPGDVRALYLGAVSWARIGRRKEALAWAAKALALDSEDSAVLYNVACLYAVLNRTEEALNCLRRVVRSGWRKEWIKNDPDLNSLRDNPEFQRLLSSNLHRDPKPPSLSNPCRLNKNRPRRLRLRLRNHCKFDEACCRS